MISLTPTIEKANVTDITLSLRYDPQPRKRESHEGVSNG